MSHALLLLALVGHAALWVTAVNRTHAMGLPRRTMGAITLLCFFFLAAVPPAFAGWLLAMGDLPRAAQAYLAACWLAAAITLPLWLRRHVLRRAPSVLRSNHTRRLDVGQVPPGERMAAAALVSEPHARHFLARLPGNECLQLDLVERVLEVPQLPRALDGLSIVHLSDFHFTGRVGKPYFEEVARLSNDLRPELVFITGDLIDHTRYIDWIPDTLGRLRAKCGVYFVLGNHDKKGDVPRLLGVLRGCGMVHVGGRWTVIEARGQRVLLAGNELPWFGPAADLGGCPSREEAPLRLFLAHTPDRLAWARAAGADLLLAGHTHGGQVRLPLIGPIFAPSLYGVTHASGLFHVPPTILHVTRGVSGQWPLRLNCAPELAHLVLRMPRP